MNTNNLKRFAQDARRKLLEQVSSKLDYVLSHDSSTLRTKAETLKRLNDEIEASGRDTVVDKVAYTWFNRLVALRFMDANSFQPMGINVLTPVSGISPQILDEAHAGHIPEELPIRKEEVMDILDGRVVSVNPDNDAYRILLVASCNQISTVFPFLFERINDYTELLLPDDLTSSFSIIKDILNGMSDEDCQEVEIIGWLYQFYISEKKDEVFASGEKVKKEDIPAATQLFTPRWIVEYMVQNTLGKLWLQNRPNSKLRDFMHYYIESPSAESDDYLKVNSVEEITLLDQASGSGHILVYGFELFSKIYEEEGYTSSEIPQLIIEKNLFGFEIDERAAQLAGFALMMKARSYHRRFFKKEVKPNILCFQDLKIAEVEIKPFFKGLGTTISDNLFHDLKTMNQATNFGSLIQPHTETKSLEETRNLLQSKLEGADIFSRPKIENLIQTLDQLILLSKKYHCIVDNPPYMGGGNMNRELSEFVKTNYPDSKADLMTCFMEAGLQMLFSKGFLGMINLPSWLFLSSFEKVRKKIIKEKHIDSLLHMGRGIFGVDWGSTAFIVRNEISMQDANYFKLHKRNFQHIYPEDIKAIFCLAKENSLIRVNFEKYREGEGISSINELIDEKGIQIQYSKNQRIFEQIPGSPIGYWISENAIQIYSSYNLLLDDFSFKRGIATGDNDRFIRFWFETKTDKLNKKWYPYNKGGDYRKWFGNRLYLVNWDNDGDEIKNLKDKKGKLRSRPQNIEFNFIPNISYSSLTSGSPSFRIYDGFINDQAGNYIVPKKETSLDNLIGLLNSKVAKYFMDIKSQTLNITADEINSIPIKRIENESLIIELIETSKKEWNSKELSWEFKRNDLLRYNENELVDGFAFYKQYWSTKFFLLHKKEQEINQLFIDAYGLNEELSPNISLDDITLLKDEISINGNEIQFLPSEVFSQFLSYSVGCMFGRYSLGKEGLILANQGETLEDYLTKVEKTQEEVTFFPDEDNIIPVLDDTWFEDDIVSRFHEFLKVTFGEKNFRKNLAFVEECLGKDIRKYFVKDFYKDHIKRYKKRPIYWSFSSPKGHFNVLIYMHRYTPDTLNRILNNYLREFIEKLQAHRKNLLHIEVSGTPVEQNKARKDINKVDEMIADCRQYETDILYPLATERISLDLDDGVLVNYNKFGKGVTLVPGLNDKKAKDKVKKFDWIDSSNIR